MKEVNALAPPTLVNSTSSIRLSLIGALLQGFTVLYQVSFERRFCDIDVFRECYQLNRMWLTPGRNLLALRTDEPRLSRFGLKCATGQGMLI